MRQQISRYQKQKVAKVAEMVSATIKSEINPLVIHIELALEVTSTKKKKKKK